MIRPGVSMWCARRRICCPVSRYARIAGGVALPADTRMKRADQYACVRARTDAVGRNQGRTAGGVRDRRGSGCAGIPAGVQEALRDGDLDSSAPRRAELLAEIKRAQEDAPTHAATLAERVIDRVDWLDIRQRTEDDDQQGAARIRPARRIGHRHERHSTVGTGSRRVGIVERRAQARRDPVPCCTASSSIRIPREPPNNRGATAKNPTIRREREMAILRQRVEFDWRL